MKSISPCPNNRSAPERSKIVLESIYDANENDAREGRFALIKPVTTSVEGRCVAMTKWSPAARAFCAILAMDISTSFFAIIIKSANSSMMITM
jgi:hypothetical protein